MNIATAAEPPLGVGRCVVRRAIASGAEQYRHPARLPPAPRPEEMPIRSRRPPDHYEPSSLRAARFGFTWRRGLGCRQEEGVRDSIDDCGTYTRDGFVFPIDLISAYEASALRSDLEAAQAELADRPDELAMLRGSTAQLLPSFAELIRHPRLVDAASQILGPDLLAWGAQCFIKDPQTPNRITWHQDLTYWGLDDQQEVTAWVALSPATRESGCMRFVAGSHRRPIVEHVDTFAEENMLSRGQEVAVDVEESEATGIMLQPGQMSLHHGHLFHASEANESDDRRIGFAIRLIATSMAMPGGEALSVLPISGEDRYGRFQLATPPSRRLQEGDFERVRRNGAISRSILMRGVDESPHG